MRALRGATTVDDNAVEAIHAATAELLDAMARENRVTPDQLVSAVFTVTPDLDAAFPAAAARRLGWGDLPMLCATEIPVPGALAHCVRVLLHVELPAAAEPRHVYLRGATGLRPDRTYD